MAVKTIVIRGTATEQRDEAVANGTMYPGHQIELQSTGKVRKNAKGAAKPAPATFAVEDDLQGDGITDQYADASLVQYVHARPGDHINAIIADGSAAVVIGDSLEPSATVGELRKAGADTSPAIVGIARSAVDASDSATTALASRRVIVEIS